MEKSDQALFSSVKTTLRLAVPVLTVYIYKSVEFSIFTRRFDPEIFSFFVNIIFSLERVLRVEVK